MEHLSRWIILTKIDKLERNKIIQNMVSEYSAYISGEAAAIGY
jgi:hypothetical protein